MGSWLLRNRYRKVYGAEFSYFFREHFQFNKITFERKWKQHVQVYTHKGVVIIYGRGAGGIPKTARTQNVPPLNNRALCFCPPSEPVH